MKKYIVLITAVLLCFQGLNAQTNTPIEKEVENWTQSYQLDETQQQLVKKMVTTKYFNLTELEAIKTTQAGLYEKKVANLDRQIVMGVKSILNENQLATYQENQAQKRNQLRQRIKTLQAQGAEKTEIAEIVEALKALN